MFNGEFTPSLHSRTFEYWRPVPVHPPVLHEFHTIKLKPSEKDFFVASIQDDWTNPNRKTNRFCIVNMVTNQNIIAAVFFCQIMRNFAFTLLDFLFLRKISLFSKATSFVNGKLQRLSKWNLIGIIADQLVRMSTIKNREVFIYFAKISIFEISRKQLYSIRRFFAIISMPSSMVRYGEMTPYFFLIKGPFLRVKLLYWLYGHCLALNSSFLSWYHARCKVDGHIYNKTVAIYFAPFPTSWFCTYI